MALGVRGVTRTTSTPAGRRRYRGYYQDCPGEREGVRMEKSSLTALAREQLELARGASSGRSSRTVYGGHEHVLRQTMIALA